MAKVTLEKIHKNYGAESDAVNNANFTCENGEMLVILGPSGCGKTTTLRMICGLEEITQGTITIGDRVVNNLSPQERNVAMAFETYALYPPLTVYENIAFPLQVMKLSKNEIKKRVTEVAKSLSITEILNIYPENLAGGQKQRVSLARALVREPTAFLMDEPLSHVDADVRHRARADIKHLQTTTNATVIYVTHDQHEAVALADRIIVMDHGVIQQIGTPMELYYQPANIFVAGFIGEPPMNLIEAKLIIDEETIHLLLSDEETPVKYNKNEIENQTIQSLEGYHGQKIMIGVRPQRVELNKPDERNLGVVTGNLLVHEFLGNYGVGQIEVDQNVLECITSPEVPFDPGDTVQLRIVFEDIHFFDQKTTNRIV